MPGIRYGCYQRLARGTVSPAGSVAATALVTVATAGFGSLVRRNQVLAVGIADNVREWLVEVAGLPPERVAVKYVGGRGPLDHAGDLRPRGRRGAGLRPPAHHHRAGRDRGRREQLGHGGAMADAIRVAASDDATVATRGAKGRERHRGHFSPEATTGALIDIYERVLREIGHHTERAD